jgi:hypothetical protein
MRLCVCMQAYVYKYLTQFIWPWVEEVILVAQTKLSKRQLHLKIYKLIKNVEFNTFSAYLKKLINLQKFCYI